MRRALILGLVLVGVLAPGAGAADPQSRIVGGSPTDIGQFPWQVAVAFDDSFGGSGFDRQWCGGSLVAPTLVVSAAHCVYTESAIPPDCDGVGAGFDPPSDYEVFTGRTNLSSNEGQVIDVAEIYYFESDGRPQAVTTGDDTGLYNCATRQWDVVLLELEGPSSSPPIQLAGGDERALWVAGQPALISGWGTVVQDGSFPDDYPDQLRAAQVQIFADPTCAANYGAAGAPFDPQVMLCAGLPTGGVDSCQGDSGGPITVRAEIGAAVGHRLIGDTSFGIGCGDPRFPGIYGRLADEPMRSTLANAAQQIAGANIVGSGARPVAPPETAIGKHPKKKLKTLKRRVRVKFTFSASEPATFRCKLDRKPARTCTSPFRPRVKLGRHKFTVSATDQLGTPDPRPDKFRWRVKRKRALR